MSTLRERRRQLLRDEIMEAARSLVAERGFHAMSMDDLAARVGVSKPTLYSQFPTKEDLLVEASREALEGLLLLAESQPLLTPLQRLCAMLESIVQIQATAQDAVGQIWMPDLLSVLRANPETDALIGQIDAVVTRLIQQAIFTGEIDPSFDSPTIARAFYGLLCAPMLGDHSHSGLPDPEGMVMTIVTLFRRGVEALPTDRETA